MRAVLSDPELLQSISPLELAAYLRGRGWGLSQEANGRFSLWQVTDDERGSFEVLVPTDRGMADYRIRITEALATLAAIEQRSQVSIVSDLKQTTADVVRLRLASEAAAGGEIQLDEGLRLIQGGRDMMLAAASAAVEPRPFYHTRRPADATSFLSRVHLAQTEAGSYVVALHSKVPPALRPDEAGQLFEAPEEPFNRRAVVKLHSALTQAKAAAVSAAASGEFDPFSEAIQAGVSANLCTALSGISDNADLRELAVVFSWAPARPLREIPEPTVRFSGDNLTILNEAAQWLKDLGGLDDYTLFGNVVALESETAQEGTATVAGLVEDVPRRVHVELGAPEYSRAIQAHRDRLPVTCTGDLHKQGRRWVMDSPRAFEIAHLSE